MRKMRHRVKSLTAMLLSACLVLSQGAFNVWAAEAVPEGVAVEAAMEAAAAEEAAAEEIVAEEAAVEEAAVEEAAAEEIAAEEAAPEEAAAEEIVAEEAVAEEAAAEEAAPEEAAAEEIATEEAAAEEIASTEEAAPEEAAAEAGPGTASSSDAEKETETTEASSTKDKATDSDAMYDEDGLLLDGKVTDDVSAEIEEELIEAPEMKQEVIAPELAEDRWYEDFDHIRNDSTRTITLKHYEGEDAMVWVEGTAQYNGKTYTVKIAEPDFYEGLFSGNTYVEDITIRDIKLPKKSAWMFSYCSNLVNVELYSADFSAVTSMAEMFYGCTNLWSVTFGSHNLSKVTDMSSMFYGCDNLEGVDLSQLEMSHVTDMNNMFAWCTDLYSLFFPDHFADSAQNLCQMFAGCIRLDEGNLEFEKFNLANATDISGMFLDCTGFTKINMEGWKLSKVTNIDSLFSGCSNLEEIDMSGVNLSSVTSADDVLYGCNSIVSIYTPSYLHVGVSLPYTMYETYGFPHRVLPVDTAATVHITDRNKYIMVTGLKINAEARTMQEGETFQLAAWPQPTNATDKTVHYFSNHSYVAEVDANGLVTAKHAGTARITISTKDGDYHKYCEITVGGVPVTSVKINTTARTMEKGSTFQMKAWPQPTNATNKVVYWTSSNPEVASVDTRGLVTALKGGTAKITAKTQDHGHTASCTITVHSPVTGVNINVTSGQKTIAAGKTFQLAAWPQPSDATDKAVTWTSSNTAVATVSSTGLVTAIKNGTANITVKTHDGGFTKVCKITVGVPVTSVKINATSRTLAAGKTFQMAAWPQPTNASNKTVTWSSSNPAVAKVSSTGIVTGVSGGIATITVKTNDGGKTASCVFTVFVPVTGVKINAKERTVEAGNTFQLAAWPQPSNADNKGVTWSSSNTAVATVDSTGLVTGIKNGTAIITVDTNDGGFTETCVITVGVPVTSVKINTTAKTISKGATFQLAAWPQPTNASNKKVTWSSSNPAVATVSSTGLVKGIKAGTAVITVKTNDGGKTAKCTITVQ